MGPEKTQEDFEVRYWLGTVAAGSWVTLLMSVAGLVYLGTFARSVNRLGAYLTLGCVALGGLLSLRGIPWRRIILSRWRQQAFLVWTFSTVVLVSLLAAFDGGAESPLALALFLPTIFSSLAYPPPFVALVAAFVEVSFVLLAVVSGTAAGYTVIFCCTIAGGALMAVWQASHHDAWRRELARSSQVDPMTGLLNRRGFSRATAAAFSALKRHGRPVTLLLGDLDSLKAYNDTHGHHSGDELLCWVAEQLAASVRPGDSVARLGGDEFAVLLPDTDKKAVEGVVGRLAEALRGRASISIGRASSPADGTTFDALYRAADADLYQRKLLRERVHGERSGRMRDLQQHRSLSPESILAGISEAFFVLDDDWKFVYVNGSAARLLGRPAHELLGTNVWEAFPEAAGSRFEEVYKRVAATGVAERFVEPYEPLQTRFSVKASPIEGGISVYFHDVTDPDPDLTTDVVGA
jgi:diguanylate cyclase (GGDEF)-like protein/PAS domain S-box-containing protein